MLTKLIQFFMPNEQEQETIIALQAKAQSHQQVMSVFKQENNTLANGLKAITEYNETINPRGYESNQNWILAQVALGNIQERNVKHIKDDFQKVRTGEAQGDAIVAVEQGVSPQTIRKQRAKRANMQFGTAELNARTL